MICWRVAAIDPAAGERERGGMLWFPRALQGDGRHDNPDLYGCLYVAAEASGAIAELLAPFRGSGPLRPAMLRREGRPVYLGRLALELRSRSSHGSIEVPAGSDPVIDVIDLDDPEVLVRERLRPSQVATRHRPATQRQAAHLYRAHPGAVALRWWSTLESRLANLTIFDRGAPLLALAEQQRLAFDHPEVSAAAELLGLI